MTEDVKLTLNTRLDWGQWLSQPIESETTTARMISLGASEFIRFKGTLTVEVTVQSEARSRRMVWRGAEEVGIA